MGLVHLVAPGLGLEGDPLEQGLQGRLVGQMAVGRQPQGSPRTEGFGGPPNESPVALRARNRASGFRVGQRGGRLEAS